MARIHCAQRLLLWAALTAAPQLCAAQPDTTTVYEDIQRFAKRSRVTRLIYDAIFVEPTDTVERKSHGSPTKVRDPNLRYRGRTIRSIHVRIMDPFGGDVEDSLGALG